MGRTAIRRNHTVKNERIARAAVEEDLRAASALGLVVPTLAELVSEELEALCDPFDASWTARDALGSAIRACISQGHMQLYASLGATEQTAKSLAKAEFARRAIANHYTVGLGVDVGRNLKSALYTAALFATGAI